MKIRVQKCGNSLALRIPKSFAAEVGLDSNSSVEISLRDGKLVVVPSEKPKFTLRQLLAQVTEKIVSPDHLLSDIKVMSPPLPDQLLAFWSKKLTCFSIVKMEKSVFQIHHDRSS